MFTDASPKDAHLFDAVKALALEKQSKVGFHFKENSFPMKPTASSAEIKTVVMLPYRDKCETALKTLSQDFTGKWRHFLIHSWKHRPKLK